MGNNTSSFGFFTRTVFVLFLLFLPAWALAHDVDGNGQEGLAEAIHALQVAAGMTPDTSSPLGNAQPSQVFAGVTFSNDNETGLVGTYHGPWGCTSYGWWNETQCAMDCYEEFGAGSLNSNECVNWCMANMNIDWIRDKLCM